MMDDDDIATHQYEGKTQSPLIQLNKYEHSLDAIFDEEILKTWGIPKGLKLEWKDNEVMIDGLTPEQLQKNQRNHK